MICVMCMWCVWYVWYVNIIYDVKCMWGSKGFYVESFPVHIIYCTIIQNNYNNISFDLLLFLQVFFNSSTICIMSINLWHVLRFGLSYLPFDIFVSFCLFSSIVFLAVIKAEMVWLFYVQCGFLLFNKRDKTAKHIIKQQILWKIYTGYIHTIIYLHKSLCSA